MLQRTQDTDKKAVVSTSSARRPSSETTEEINSAGGGPTSIPGSSRAFDVLEVLPRKKSVTWSASLTEVREYELQEGERDGKRNMGMGMGTFLDMEHSEHQLEKEGKNRQRHPTATVPWPHLRPLEDTSNGFVRGAESIERAVRQVRHEQTAPTLFPIARQDSPNEPPDVYPTVVTLPKVVPLVDMTQMAGYASAYLPGPIDASSSYTSSSAAAVASQPAVQQYTPGSILKDDELTRYAAFVVRLP